MFLGWLCWKYVKKSRKKGKGKTHKGVEKERRVDRTG